MSEKKDQIGEMTARDVLLVVDVQKDLCEGGMLAVPGAEEVMGLINRLQDLFATVVLSRDWHPANHVSFSAEPKYANGSWPRHCVAGTPGAAFHGQLNVPLYARVISKGTKRDRDSGSVFEECPDFNLKRNAPLFLTAR